MSNRPTIGNLFLSFLRLGLTAFGGPAMVAYVKELSVHKKQWLDEETFKNGIALCQSIPGATVMQMAAYVGLVSRGIKGALLTYIGFGLPAFILMMIFSALYITSHNIPKVISLFNGLQVIVVAIVAYATYTFAKGILKNYWNISTAILSAIFFWSGISPFVVIIGTALIGIVFFRNETSLLPSSHDRENKRSMFKNILLLFVILLAGFVGLYLIDKKLFELAILMLKIDLFAFGGGFGSVPLMLHEIVNVRGWMDSKTFMDGIALGQVTPGPIVITATFVGYLVYGLLGAVVATISIFTPSFLILVVVTPFFNKLKTSAYFLKATKGVLASFVGLLFYTTVKFTLAVPWDIVRVLLVLAAFITLVKRMDVIYIVLIGATISIFIF